MTRILGGKHRGRPLKVPRSGLRPSMGQLKGALFSIIGPSIEGARFLDLFAGSGAVGLEALSRGAALACFVERDRKGCSIIKENISLLGEEGEVVAADVDSFLGAYRGPPFDLIFADPPYGLEWEPSRLIPLLRPGGSCFIEEGRGAPPPDLSPLVWVKERRYGGSSLYEWRAT